MNRVKTVNGGRNSGGLSGGGRPGVGSQNTGGGQRTGGSMSRMDCEKKYCPICGDDDVVLLGRSTDDQCMKCKAKYKSQIEACIRGNDGGRGNTYDSFKKYRVYQCLNRKWDPYVKKYKQWYTYHICGAEKVCPSGGTIVSCNPVTTYMTEVQCNFEIQRLQNNR